MARDWNIDDPWIPSVYVVAWPDGIWKVGYSGTRERWGKFIGRGARLVDLVEFRTEFDARRYERDLAAAFAFFTKRAFWSADGARRYMGGTSATGWTECFFVPSQHRERFFDESKRVLADPASAKTWESSPDPITDLAWLGLLCAAWVRLDDAGLNGQHPWGHIPWRERRPVVRARELPVAKPEMWVAA